MEMKLSVQGISKSFRLRRGGSDIDVLKVLQSISFDIRQGEVVSLVGESGCGKTTLLRIVQGLVASDQGRIVVDGHAVAKPGRDRGFVFQHATLLPWRSARENVEFGLELADVDKEERRRLANALMKLVGLERFTEHYPHELSGGMQQRIGLARALAIQPAILLMDEPFSALDAQTREILQRELMRIHGETRQTILFVTHDLDEAIYLSDRVLVMAAKPGRIRESIPISLPRPRPDPVELRGHAHFQEMRTKMWNLIRAS
jgi:NitT/TauT family transport system ATP-binding protein